MTSVLGTMANDFVQVERRGNVACMVLSRPKALNSLDLPMVRTLWSSYLEAASDPKVSSILLTGAGEKAFCAGGDVRAVVEAARKRSSLAPGEEDISDLFFREVLASVCYHHPCLLAQPLHAQTNSLDPQEYALNAAIAGSPKPQVSVWDGIVMGGGAGVSVHGAFRIATEKALFAMPETSIGFFPDVRPQLM